MGKRAIRQRLLHLREQLDELSCRQLSLKVQRNVLNSDCFTACRTLALYSPIRNEVDTDLLLQMARSGGKRVCYPRVDGALLDFAVVTDDNLEPGAFGVAEPIGGEVVALDEIDLLVVPGVAFDRRGFRLGYGKGFYDRELAAVRTKIVTVGLCYEFQLCPPLPTEPHDQRLDFIATEIGLIPCRKDAPG